MYSFVVWGAWFGLLFWCLLVELRFLIIWVALRFPLDL